MEFLGLKEPKEIITDKKSLFYYMSGKYHTFSGDIRDIFNLNLFTSTGHPPFDESLIRE